MYKNILCIIMFLTLKANFIVPQQNSVSSEEWLRIDDKLINHLVIATEKNTNVVRGLLSAVKGDSLYISNKNKITTLSLKDLISVTIVGKETSLFPTLIGAISGMYLGSILFLTADDQPGEYLEYEELGILALYELLFATVGGGIGYLIDQTFSQDQETFYFTGDNEKVEKEIMRFKSFLSGKYKTNKLKFTVNLAQVGTRLSQLPDQYNSGYYYYSYDYHDIHSFNMLRSLSLTYNIIEGIDLGIAVNWFGEPAFSYYSTSYQQNTVSSQTITQNFKGNGFYFIVKYNPLQNILSDNIVVNIGSGIGLGKIDFNLSNQKTFADYTQEPFTENVIDNSRIINKTSISYLATGELAFKIYPALNLSLYVDYVYLPEKMPAIPELKLDERNLGNFSYGLGIGFNF